MVISGAESGFTVGGSRCSGGDTVAVSIVLDRSDVVVAIVGVSEE